MMRPSARKLATGFGTERACAAEAGKQRRTMRRAVTRMRLIMSQVSMAFEKWQFTAAETDEGAGEEAADMQ